MQERCLILIIITDVFMQIIDLKKLIEHAMDSLTWSSGSAVMCKLLHIPRDFLFCEWLFLSIKSVKTSSLQPSLISAALRSSSHH